MPRCYEYHDIHLFDDEDVDEMIFWHKVYIHDILNVEANKYQYAARLNKPVIITLKRHQK